MAPWLDDAPLWLYKPQIDKVLCWLPKKCEISGESLWFKRAYRVRYHHWGVHEDQWFCEREYLWKILKDG